MIILTFTSMIQRKRLVLPEPGSPRIKVVAWGGVGTDFSGDAPSESWDKDGDGIMSYTECTMYTFETLEECDAMFGMGDNDNQFPAQEP